MYKPTEEEGKILKEATTIISKILDYQNESNETVLQTVSEPVQSPSLLLTQCAKSFQNKGLKICSTDISGEMFRDEFITRRNGSFIPTVKGVREGMCENINFFTKNKRPAKTLNNVQVRLTPKAQEYYWNKFNDRMNPTCSETAPVINQVTIAE
jgi:hypothetical protein